MENEIAQISKAVNDLGAKIESGYATKHDLQKHADAVSALSKAMDQKRLEEKTDPVFGNKKNAMDFIDSMKSAIAKSNVKINKTSPFYAEKSDLDTSTSSGGTEYVTTGTSNVLSYLLEQGGVNRRECTVYNGIVGEINLPKRSAASTAMVFTAADDTSLTDDGPTTGKVTLSPKQISGLTLVSEKLLYASAVNIAELVALDLTEQAAKLEDEALIRGDGTSAYGSVTGINTVSGLNENQVEVSDVAVDSFLALMIDVAEEAQSSPNSKFYMHPVAVNFLRTAKASSSGVYHFDPSSGNFLLGGKEIVVWHRLDSTIAAGKFPVVYGDMRKAVVVGTGRDYSLAVDHSFKFGSNQAAFRLTYDWQAQFIQPTALSRFKVIADA